MRAALYVVLGLVVCGSVNACSSGGSGSAGNGTANNGAGGHAGAAATNKAFAECCTSDSECASGVCSTKHQACSVACTTDDDCPPEPKSGKPSCSQSHAVCEAERSDVSCEYPDGTGGASGSDGNSSDAGSSGGAGAASSGGTPGTGGLTGSGGATTGSPHLVQCSALAQKEPFNNETSSDICRCRGDANTGAISYRGEGCGQGDTELFCCGDTDYPSAGSCTCYQKRTWQCTEAFVGTANAFCECWYYGKIENYASQVPTTSCDTETKSYATRCYVADVTGGQRCQCDARALPAGAREVQSCSTAADAQVTVTTACSAEQKSVSTCSTGLYVPPSGGGCGSGCSGTQCVGDGLCCVYVCDNDECKQNCNF